MFARLLHPDESGFAKTEGCFMYRPQSFWKRLGSRIRKIGDKQHRRILYMQPHTPCKKADFFWSSIIHTYNSSIRLGRILFFLKEENIYSIGTFVTGGINFRLYRMDSHFHKQCLFQHCCFLHPMLGHNINVIAIRFSKLTCISCFQLLS